MQSFVKYSYHNITIFASNTTQYSHELFSSQLQPASYGKKSNTWYAPSGGAGGGGTGGTGARGSIGGGVLPGVGAGALGGWQSRSTPAVASLSRKASITDEAPPPGGGKPSSGRVIRIVNNLDHTVQVWLLFFNFILKNFFLY